MEFDTIRKYCLSFQGAAEQLQWENHILFKVGGKMFLIYNLDKSYQNRFSIKCTPENFAILTELDNIIPAPYLARNSWINFKEGYKMNSKQVKELIAESYNLVFAKLPKKEQKKINTGIE